MPAGLVNQLMTCYWLESGIELESQDKETSPDILAEIAKIRKRSKPIFDF